MVEWLFLAVPWGCLRFVIVVFTDHTHFLYLICILTFKCVILGANPGFLERGLVCIKMWGGRIADFISILLISVKND